MKPAAELTLIEDLDRNILTLCTNINAATYELLVLIREFDERVGWLKWGLKNCAEWPVEVTKTICWCSRCEQRQPTLLSDAVNCAVVAKILSIVPQRPMPSDPYAFVVIRIDTR